MRVALIGATGNVGSRVLAELVRRGHSVTVISRNPDMGRRSWTSSPSAAT